jgi:hypothetical protein
MAFHEIALMYNLAVRESIRDGGCGPKTEKVGKSCD